MLLVVAKPVAVFSNTINYKGREERDRLIT